MRLAKVQHKAILFNGPPRSGKDTCASMAYSYLGYPAVYRDDCRLSAPLKQAVHSMFGLGSLLDPEYYDKVKDTPNEAFLGKTPREAYIGLAEDYLKPTYGKEFFGHALVNSMKQFISSPRTFIVPDLGFQEELDPIVAYLGLANVSVILIGRPGCDFSKDSRGHVVLSGGRNYLINNSGTLEDLRKELESTLSDILTREGDEEL